MYKGVTMAEKEKEKQAQELEEILDKYRARNEKVIYRLRNGGKCIACNTGCT